MKDFCKYCFNDPVIHNCQKELCGVCEMETEVAKPREVCQYCHEDRDGYVIPIEKNCHAYIVFPNTLRLKFDRQARECKINYCPMCGRKLGWDEA